MRLVFALVVVALLACASPVRADEPPKSHPGRMAWVGVLASVGVYELWAVKTHHETMSQEVQHSKGLSIAVGVGLGALSVHLFVIK